MPSCNPISKGYGNTNYIYVFEVMLSVASEKLAAYLHQSFWWLPVVVSKEVALLHYCTYVIFFK